MADEVELTALIVPLRADVDQLQMGFKRAEEQVRQTVSRIDAEMARIKRASMTHMGAGGAGRGMDEMAGKIGHANLEMRGLHRLAHVAIRIPELRNAQQGLHLLGMGAMQAGFAFHRLLGPGAMVAGIGLAVLVQVMTKLNEYWNRNQTAAAKAFEEMVKGAKNFDQVMAEMRIERLQEGLKDAVNFGLAIDNLGETLGNIPTLPGLGGLVQGTAGGATEDIMARAIDDAERRQHILLQLRNNERYMAMVREIATDRATSAISQENLKLEQQAQRLSMGEDAAKRYERAQQLAVAANISIEEALTRVNAQLDRQRVLQQAIAAGRTLDEARKTAEEVQRAGMGTNVGRAFAMAQAEAGRQRGTFGAPTADDLMRTERYRLLLRALAMQDIAKLMEQNVKLGMEADRLNMEFTVGADAAERYGHVLEYAHNNMLSLEQAENDLRGAMNQRRAMQDVMAMKPAYQRLAELAQEAGRIGMVADESARFAQIQKYAAQTRREDETAAQAQARAIRELATVMALQEEMQDRLAAAKVFEEVMMPMDRFALRVQDLDRLLAKGRISTDTYGQAILKAKNEILKMAQAQQRLSAVSVGTAEDVALMTEYFGNLRRAVPNVDELRPAINASLAATGGAVERLPAGPIQLPGLPRPGEAGGFGALAGQAAAGALGGESDAAQSWALTVADSAQNWASAVLSSSGNFFTNVDAAAQAIVNALPRPTPAAAEDWLDQLEGAGGGGAGGWGQQALTSLGLIATLLAQGNAQPALEIVPAGIT